MSRFTIKIRWNSCIPMLLKITVSYVNAWLRRWDWLSADTRLQSTIKQGLIETFVALFSQWQKKMELKTFTKLQVTCFYLKICTYKNVGFMDRFNITHMHQSTLKVQFQCKWWKKRSTGLVLYKNRLLNSWFCSILT